MEKIRTIKLFKSYYKDFYVKQKEIVRQKINFVLKLIETQPFIPKKFFKFIENSDGIYEIRIEVESNIYRIFCCLDEGAIIVLFHGFQKKTQKTPRKEGKEQKLSKWNILKARRNNNGHKEKRSYHGVYEFR